MPSSMTHTYFGKDVLKDLPNNIKEKIDEQFFYLFSQGSDPFMFYHFLLGKKAKKVMSIQNTMHTKNTRDFFINTIKLIHEKKLLNNKEIISFLCGYIAHYYLDSYTHPYIYYKSGLFKKSDKSTYKNNGKHQEIEYNIDLYMIAKREKEKPYKYKVYKNIFNINSFSQQLSNFINETIEKTYQYKNISTLYLKCIHYMKSFFKYINYDPYGIKLFIYKTIDNLTPPQTLKLTKLSYHHNFQDNLSYLNLEHKNWTLPWDNSTIFTTSFIDLYNNALKDCTKTISEVITMLEKKELDETRLKEIFKNNSYSTGENCNKKIELKYFETEN